MLGFLSKKVSSQEVPPPVGIAEIMICVFDEKHRVLHHFTSSRSEKPSGGSFSLLNNPDTAFGSPVFAEVVEHGVPSSLALSFGATDRKYLYILPYEHKREKKRVACMQVQTEKSDSGSVSLISPLAKGNVCILLADGHGAILTVGADAPESFGFTSESFAKMKLSDFFTSADLGIISACLPDTGEPILSCTFQCVNGSKCDVEILKYALPNGCMLYTICDVTRARLNDDVTQISTRERRRIGQDLHDSIGQILTGISLLSRSLANGLKRDGNPGDADAAQISELADDASDQIRQISRGLMPSDIVHRGLMASLQHLARITTESCGLQCDTALDEQVEFADGAIETHLFRITQEAVNNAVRHANAKRILISVSQVNGISQLEISDDGQWKGIQGDSTGIGMKTMHYRASVIEGRLSVGPMEQGGTSVICRMEPDEVLETKA